MIIAEVTIRGSLYRVIEEGDEVVVVCGKREQFWPLTAVSSRTKIEVLAQAVGFVHKKEREWKSQCLHLQAELDKLRRVVASSEGIEEHVGKLLEFARSLSEVEVHPS